MILQPIVVPPLSLEPISPEFPISTWHPHIRRYIEDGLDISFHSDDFQLPFQALRPALCRDLMVHLAPMHLCAQIKLGGVMTPSDFWRRNIRVAFQEDPLGLQLLRELIGPETMMWGNDYPHRESTWPRSLEAIEETFQGVPEDERAMIVGGNATKLYSIQ